MKKEFVTKQENELNKLQRKLGRKLTFYERTLFKLGATFGAKQVLN